MSAIACCVAHMSDEFQTMGEKERHSLARQKERWKKPSTGVLKINSDGAFRASTGTGGWGFVIRDDQGDVVKAGAGHCQHLLDAFHVEMIACLMGIRAAAELGISNVIVETDSSMVKVALETSTFALAATGAIVFEVKSLLRFSFESSLVTFCYRDSNRVTHALAAQGCTYPSGDILSWDSCPSWTMDLVASDIAESLS